VHGIHGGAIETAIMQHIGPEAVRTDRIDDFTPATVGMLADHPALGAAGVGPGRQAGFVWQAQDLNPQGAAGDPRQATAEIGAALVAEAADRLAAIFADIDQADPNRLLREPDFPAART